MLDFLGGVCKILQSCHTFWHCWIPQSNDPPGVLVKSPTNSLDITTLPRFQGFEAADASEIRRGNDELRPGEYPHYLRRDSYMLGGWPWDF